ncbi:TonB-dependent receptor [Carboxylicivirga mesophila]|uniref:TonB-dependent receptor n=1 Tax=Carboxylicivirga mesophila TaxID=1166478 RepID=A0ABS5KDL7_9BACT|nr:TonB-dependent receptor [Carboxylicivirga mesophila]MBS2213134.1 TonB-dependent receptor [Carboxylicivirga mesophila]
MKKVLIALSFMVMFGLQVIAQTTNVTGIVTDAADGSPIPGVSVFVKGTTIGTVTMPDGKYTLAVPNNSTAIVFSFVGMSTQEIAYTGQTTINAVMQSDAVDVGEVVVTAYGTKGKVGLKGAITTVGAEELEQVPMATFDQALQGKTSGLYIGSGSGQPGTDNTKVRIRGNASITGSNEPLYVVDGVPIEGGVFATLNTNDFETISVLKDASATSIYGSRASNGVILVTTKQGRKGKTKVTYRYQTGWSSKTREKFDMMNSEEKLWFEELAKRGEGWRLSPSNPDNADLTPEELAANAAELNRLRGINTKWDDVFTRTGRTNSHEVNMSGGSEKTTFYFALQNFYQEGQALRSDLDRTIGRLNVDHKISDKIRVGIKTSLGHSKSSRIESEGGIALANPFAAAYLANPYEVPYDEDGNIPVGSGKTGANALERLLKSSDDKQELKGVGALSVEWDIISDLTFKTQYGIDYRNTTYEDWTDPNSRAGESVTRGNKGAIAYDYEQRFEHTWTNTLDYKKVVGDHTFGGLLGVEFNERDYVEWGFTGYGLDPLLPKTPAAITPGTNENNMIPQVRGGKTKRALYSLFSIFNYNYAGRYALTASIRRDGSSAFGTDNQYAYLYSLGAIWTLSEEAFLSNANWIDNLKLRVSYGTTGNQQGIADYEHLTTWAPGSYGGVQTIGLARTGDPSIKWEIGQKFNAGIDYNLFRNRISGSIDFYNDITSDLFITQTVSHTAGIIGNSKDVNAGKMRNRGIELLLNADIIRAGDLVVSVGGNLSYNDNEILDLGQVSEFEQGTSIIKEGLPYGTHYIVKWAGVDPLTGNPLYYTKDGAVTEKYSEDDAVTAFGTSEPPLIGGFNASVSWKGIELSTQFTFANDFARFNNQTFFQENPNFTQFNLSSEMLNIWQQPGDITEIQRLGTEREFSSKDIEDASYLRWRNLTISYNLPSDLLRKTKFIEKVRLYAQGQNLFTWTSFTGFDPEDSNNIATYEYPASRIVTMGVDISF